MTAPPNTGLALALELHEEYSNEWGGSVPAEELAAATYAVCIKRIDDGWVVAADDWQTIADIIRDCMLTDGSEVEYVDAVYHVASGEVVKYRTTATIALRTPDGETYLSCDPVPDPAWEIVLRHSDYGNDFETFPGMTPGVRGIEIDPGADFTNGRPSRFWCAQRYFELEDDTPTNVKRAFLEKLKALCSGDDKLKRGVDPGTW